MDRRRLFHVFQAARERGPHDEFPALRDGLDPQVHLSRPDRPQPFFLICDHDTLVAAMAGTGALHLREAPVHFYDLEPGDYVYVPAGMPSRIVPDGELVVLRFKKLAPALEGVAWYCESCDARLWRWDFDLDGVVPQRRYQEACERFNADAEVRTCGRCGLEAPLVDLDGCDFLAIEEEVLASAGSRIERAGIRSLSS